MTHANGFERQKQEARRTGPGVTVEVDHSHDELELNLVLGGRGTYFLDDTHHDLAPGTLVWLLPGQRHRLMRSPDFDIWVLHIDPRHLGAEFLGDISTRSCCTLATEDVIALDRLLSHVSQDMQEPTLYRIGLEYAVRSAHYIAMNSDCPIQITPHPAVLKALSFLRANTDVPSSAALAKSCGVSQNYLGELLVAQTGRGFVEWRNRARLERFHLLYAQRNDLLSSALAAGFGSYPQFHRVFLNIIGVTPGQWAKNGGGPSVAAMPTLAALPTGNGKPGNRVIWYKLNELALPTISRWFRKNFAKAFRASDGAYRHAGIECEPLSSDMFNAFLNDIIADVSNIDPAAAQGMTQLLARQQIFDDYIATLGNFGFSRTDLSEVLGLYLTLAWAGANGHALPNKEDISRVIAKTRNALNYADTFKHADLTKQQGVVVALQLQSMILRGAFLMARSSGNEILMRRVSDGAQQSVLEAFGLDLRAVKLLKK